MNKHRKPVHIPRVSNQAFYFFNEGKPNAKHNPLEIEHAEISTQTKTGNKNKNEKRSLLYKYPSVTVTSTRPKPLKRRNKYMLWQKYHRLSTIYSFIDNLEKDFPAICTVSIIGKSVEGRAIKLLKITNSDAKNQAVWLDAAIHSREWISTSVVTYIADYIARNFNTLSPAITTKDWHILPVMNPDGYEYTHTRDRMWRKNKACIDGQCVGVDLNRNFGYGWGRNGEEGSSEEPSSPFYRGTGPFSEPETVAVRDAVLGSLTPFKVFLSFHSYYELIIFPWGCKSDNPPDYLNLLEGATAMARAIYETNRKSYKVGTTKDLTYHACGTSTDWSYSVAKIPYSYMIELRSRKYKFKLPTTQIIDTCVEMWNGVHSLMEYVDKH